MNKLTRNVALLFPAGLVGGLILALLSGTTAGAQPLALAGVQPTGGAPGQSVQLQGQGFVRSADAYFAWGSDGERGFVLDVGKKRSPSQLSAVLSQLYADVEAPVRLWQGRRKSLAPFEIGGGRWVVRDAFVFRPNRAAEGPTFDATAGASPGFAGRLVGGDIRLELGAPPAVVTTRLPAGEEDTGEEEGTGRGDGSFEVRSILVEGSGESCGPPDDGGDSSGGGSGFTSKGFGFALRIECLGQGPCHGNPATLLGVALDGVLRAVGVETTVQGSTVALSLSQPLCAAALNVSVSPALARGGALPQGGNVLASSPSRSSATISR